MIRIKKIIYFLDGTSDGLNLKTYPNEQTIKESKSNLISLL